LANTIVLNKIKAMMAALLMNVKDYTQYKYLS